MSSGVATVQDFEEGFMTVLGHGRGNNSYDRYVFADFANELARQQTWKADGLRVSYHLRGGNLPMLELVRTLKDPQVAFDERSWEPLREDLEIILDPASNLLAVQIRHFKLLNMKRPPSGPLQQTAVNVIAAFNQQQTLQCLGVAAQRRPSLLYGRPRPQHLNLTGDTGDDGTLTLDYRGGGFALTVDTGVAHTFALAEDSLLALGGYLESIVSVRHR